MPEYVARTREEKAEAKRRKKTEPLYDQLKQAAELEESQAKPALTGLPVAEATLELQRVYGNRYVQRLFPPDSKGNRDTITRLHHSSHCIPASSLSLFHSSPEHGNHSVQQQAQQGFIIQRQAETGAPFPPFRLAPELQLQLPPDIEVLIAIQNLQQRLDPLSIKPALLEALLELPLMNLPIPQAEPPARLVPAGPGPATPQPGTYSDIFNAILAIPVIDAALTTLQMMAIERLKEDFRRLRTGEKIAVISTFALIGASALAGVLSDPSSRQFALGQLNGIVLPVPGVTGLSLEFNTQGDNLMLGFQLDIGGLLPSWLGFGSSSTAPIGGPPETVARLAEGSKEATLEEDIIRRIEAQRGSGKSLEPEVRSEMETAFGQDFSKVRVHTDAEADRLSRQLRAKAFTTRKDIFFREGAYEPISESGTRLIKHELAHVMQQSESLLTEPTKVSQPSERVEIEANKAEEATEPLATSRSSPGVVARQATLTENDIWFLQVEWSQDVLSPVSKIYEVLTTGPGEVSDRSQRAINLIMRIRKAIGEIRAEYWLKGGIDETANNMQSAESRLLGIQGFLSAFARKEGVLTEIEERIWVEIQRQIAPESDLVRSLSEIRGRIQLPV